MDSGAAAGPTHRHKNCCLLWRRVVGVPLRHRPHRQIRVASRFERKVECLERLFPNRADAVPAETIDDPSPDIPEGGDDFDEDITPEEDALIQAQLVALSEPLGMAGLPQALVQPTTMIEP